MILCVQINLQNKRNIIYSISYSIDKALRSFRPKLGQDYSIISTCKLLMSTT